MGKERESFADYVRRIRQEKRLSLNDLRIASGNRIANSHISRIENGEVKNLGVEKLSALAKGLGVPEEEVFTVARGAQARSLEGVKESQLLTYFRELPPDRQRDVLLIVKTMHREYAQ